MTENEARGYIKGKLDCMNECGVFNREDSENTDLCDNCHYCYSQGNFGQQKEAFSMAIKALEKQKDNGWIPCSERLPEAKEKRFGNKQKRTDVLVTLRNGLVKEMTFEFATKEFWEAGDENQIEHWKEDANDSGCEVIAWQPLPEPYKECEKE